MRDRLLASILSLVDIEETESTIGEAFLAALNLMTDEQLADLLVQIETGCYE